MGVDQSSQTSSEEEEIWNKKFQKCSKYINENRELSEDMKGWLRNQKKKLNNSPQTDKRDERLGLLNSLDKADNVSINSSDKKPEERMLPANFRFGYVGHNGKKYARALKPTPNGKSAPLEPMGAIIAISRYERSSQEPTAIQNPSAHEIEPPAKRQRRSFESWEKGKNPVYVIPKNEEGFCL